MTKGLYCTVETKKKMSEAHKGKHYKSNVIYILDNRRTDLLYFNTLAEVCKFLGYKNVRGFKSGNAYRGYIFTKTLNRKTNQY